MKTLKSKVATLALVTGVGIGSARDDGGRCGRSERRWKELSRCLALVPVDVRLVPGPAAQELWCVGAGCSGHSRHLLR